MRIHWGYALTVLILFLISACDQGSQLMSQAQQAYDAATDAAANAGLLPGSSQQGSGSNSEQILGSSTAGASGSESIEIKKNIDPQFAFVQTYLSGRWVQEPYSIGCEGKPHHYVEFSFDGNTVTQYDHWYGGSVVVTVAAITSAKQLNKSLGRGKTLVGEVNARRVSMKGSGGTPQGFSKPKIALISGDFSENSPSFSGKGLYSNGQSVGVGFPQLMACSGAFEKREYP